jgi:hypothetical protein
MEKEILSPKAQGFSNVHFFIKPFVYLSFITSYLEYMFLFSIIVTSGSFVLTAVSAPIMFANNYTVTWAIIIEGIGYAIVTQAIHLTFRKIKEIYCIGEM